MQSTHNENVIQVTTNILHIIASGQMYSEILEGKSLSKWKETKLDKIASYKIKILSALNARRREFLIRTFQQVFLIRSSSVSGRH